MLNMTSSQTKISKKIVSADKKCFKVNFLRKILSKITINLVHCLKKGLDEEILDLIHFCTKSKGLITKPFLQMDSKLDG